MGLEERRKVEELRNKTLPQRTQEIQQISGAEVKLEIDWESFQNDAGALKFLDNVVCHRLNTVLRIICKDDLGKQAVREGLREVRVRNVDSTNDKAVEFANGVLSMRGAYAKGISGAVNDKEIRETLMSSL